jgi:phosphomannomutase
MKAREDVAFFPKFLTSICLKTHSLTRLYLQGNSCTMTLIKSISGIRGTIGGSVSDNLTPIDIVLFASAYAAWLKNRFPGQKVHVVVGRDARISGEMVSSLVLYSLSGMGVHTTDLGMATTPTVEIMVPELKAHGGLIITASHNPKQWNALKMLNEKGEFLNAEEGARILEMAENRTFSYATVDDLGKTEKNNSALDVHIKRILNHPLVDREAISKANFSIVVDAVRSVGEIAVPEMLMALGVQEIVMLYGEADGQFPHNPEPLEEHLQEIIQKVKETGGDMGIVVDPDVDRLAFVTHEGKMFGEEYTLVAAADYYLSHKPGNTVSNMSSSRALRDITEKHGGKHFASAVGEVNVVEMMKEKDAVIGGEGNGGVIVPELHYGRDALAGIALVLSFLARAGKSLAQLRSEYPAYFMSKQKIELAAGMNPDAVLEGMAAKYAGLQPSTIDGVKIDFEDEWVHLRKSNTEPIVRIYSEAKSQEGADKLADRFVEEIKAMF